MKNVAMPTIGGEKPMVGMAAPQVRARGRRGDAQLGAGADGGGVRPEDYYAYANVVAP